MSPHRVYVLLGMRLCRLSYGPSPPHGRSQVKLAFSFYSQVTRGVETWGGGGDGEGAADTHCSCVLMHM